MKKSKRVKNMTRRLLTSCITLMLVFGLIAPMVSWAEGTESTVESDIVSPGGIASPGGIEGDTPDALDPDHDAGGDVGPKKGPAKVADSDVKPIPKEKMPQVSLYTKYDYNEREKSEALKSGSELSLDTMIYMEFFWENLDGLDVEQRYELCSISDYYLQLAGIGRNQDIYAEKEDGSRVKIAELTVDENGRVCIERLKADENDYAEDVYGAFACTLAKGACEANNKDGQITINLPNNNSVNINVTQLMPKAPALEKKMLTIDDNGEVTWTIRYTAAASAYKGDKIPEKLVDTLPKGMEYVPGSVSVSGDAINTFKPECEKSDQGNQILTWTVSREKNGALTELTYKTKLTDAALSALWSGSGEKKYTNLVDGCDADGKPMGGDLSKTAEADFSDWIKNYTVLNKEGIYSDTDRTIKWTVTVKPVSLNFAYLRVIDTMGAELELDEDSVKVNDVPVKNVSGGAFCSKTKLGDGRTEMTLWLYGDPATKEKTDKGEEEITSTADERKHFELNSNGEYEITYTTKVSDKYFYEASDKKDSDVTNSARLEWQWLFGGKGPGGTPPVSPTIGKGPGALGLNNKLLIKTGEKYDPETHILTWRVSVNESKLNIVSARFEDSLANDGIIENKKDGEKYKLELAYADVAALKTAITDELSGSGASVDNVEFIKSDDKRNIGFRCTFSTVDKETITFPVKVEVIDPSFWAANHDVTETSATNVATLSAINIKTQQNEDKTLSPITDRDSVSPYSNMLKKDHIGFEFDEANNCGYIKWVLRINENATESLGAATITDTLPDGLKYYYDAEHPTLFVNGKTDRPIQGTASGQTVTWTLNTGDINGNSATLTYQTKVDFNALPSDLKQEFLERTTVGFENNVELGVKFADTTVTSGAISTATLGNTVLSKSQTQSQTEKNKISYTVVLNPYGISIASPAGAKLSLKDCMPAGLAVDLTTVKLYKAERKADQSKHPYSITMKKTGANQISEDQLGYEMQKLDSGEIQSVLTIPIDDQTPYVLEYDAAIVQTNVKLENQIKIAGSALGGQSGLSNHAVAVRLDSYGGAKYRPKSNWTLEVTKIDKANGQLIKASEGNTAKFGLYKNGEAEPFLEAVCDTDGVCIFSQPKAVLNGVMKLELKEITAPKGYKLVTEPVDLTNRISELVPKATLTLKVENEKLPSNPDPSNPDTPGDGGGGTDTPGGGNGGGTGTPGGGGGTGTPGGGGGTGTPGGGGTGGGSVTSGDGNTPADPEKPDSEKDPADDKDDKDPADDKDDKDPKDDKEDKDDKDPKDDKEDKDDKDKNNSKPKPTKKPSKDKNSGKTNNSGKSDQTGGTSGSGGSKGASGTKGTSGSQSYNGAIKSGSGEGSGTKVSNAKSGAQDTAETVDGAKQPAIPQTGQNWYGVAMLVALGVLLLLGAIVISPLCEERMSEEDS